MSGLDATQLQGVPISTNTPTDGQGLLYDAATGMWTPTNISSAPTGPAGGDLGGGYPNPSVVQLHGSPVTNLTGLGPSSTDGILGWNGSTWNIIYIGSSLSAGAGISITPGGGSGNQAVITNTEPAVGASSGMTQVSSPVTYTGGAFQNIMSIPISVAGGYKLTALYDITITATTSYTAFLSGSVSSTLMGSSNFITASGQGGQLMAQWYGFLPVQTIFSGLFATSGANATVNAVSAAGLGGATSLIIERFT